MTFAATTLPETVSFDDLRSLAAVKGPASQLLFRFRIRPN